MNKLSRLKIFSPVPLRIFLLIAVVVLGVSAPSLAAAQAPQVREAYTRYFLYRFVAGSSLHTADYTMRQNYQPGACISVQDTATQFLNLSLQLPDGARIEYLRLFYYDTDATTNGNASLRKYDGFGKTTVIASTDSASNAGYGTSLSAYVGHVVDNSDGGYVLNWWPKVTGSTMRLCGLRIAYRLPVTSTFLPYLFR